jgi:hypothetical protein
LYTPGTILVLNEPQSTEEKPFAYDKVEVVGPSPVNHGVQSDYTGADAQGVIIKTAGEEFGPNLDEPFGKLRSIYTVEYQPELVPNILNPSQTPEGMTPEQVFEALGKASGRTKSQVREQTPIAPDPRSPEDVLAGLTEPTEKPGVHIKPAPAKTTRAKRSS